MDYLVRVEVEPGHDVPFKKMTLRRELMCMKLPPKEDETLGDSFINGAHSFFTAPKVRKYARVGGVTLPPSEEICPSGGSNSPVAGAQNLT